MKDRPIGVFDSGLGGLTVLSSIHKYLPKENLIYFGDTARVPYGSKSKETIIRYSKEILEFLLQKGVKVVVVACNTSSSYALEELKKISPVEVIGVVEPALKYLKEKYPNISKAGVIATRSTIRSGSYPRLLKKYHPSLFLYTKACPLLVPLVEEGFLQKKVTEEILKEYLEEIHREGIRHLILGCTHYPLLIPAIKRLYPDFTLISSSDAVARELKEILTQKDLLNPQGEGRIELYLSDITENMEDLARLFFGEEIHKMEKIALEF